MRLTPYLFFQIQLILAQLTYEQGSVRNIDNFSGPKTITKTITFSNTFLKIPQIIIQLQDLSLGYQINEANFQITSVTLTDFQCKVNFPFDGYVGKYYFKWLAINEDRIQVINPPKETIVINGVIYTVSHTFQQATQAVIMLSGFGFVPGGLNFDLQVLSVSSTNVKIQLQTTTTNIQSINYQIILGTKEAFYATNVQNTGGGTSILGEYTEKILQNSILFYPFVGLHWTGTNSVRVASSSTTISSDYQYTYSSFSGTYMTSVTCQSIQFFTKILFPYYAKKYIVSKQFVEFPSNQILVKFIELNQSFNSDTSQTLNLLSTQIELNVQIEIALSSGKKVQGYFLKCNECGNNNKHIINQSYYNQGSFIKFRIQLLQQTNEASNLIFSMTSNKILIQQVINQAVDIYDIILLELINA